MNYRIVNGQLYSCDSELYHHGVKGMKWGKRKVKSKLGRALAVRKYDVTDKQIKQFRKDVDERNKLVTASRKAKTAQERSVIKTKISDLENKHITKIGKEYMNLVVGTSLKETTYIDAGRIGGALGTIVGASIHRKTPKRYF